MLDSLVLKGGMIRDPSLHPDPLEKLDIFVLSENIWNQGP